MSMVKPIRNRAGTLVACLTVIAAAPALAQSAADSPTGDAAIKQKVLEALSSDKGLYAKHIDVSVKGGVVRLAGFVGEPAEIELAKKDAEHVAGVKTVNNQMTVKAGSSESATSH